jgi:hypothetical protein
MDNFISYLHDALDAIGAAKLNNNRGRPDVAHEDINEAIASLKNAQEALPEWTVETVTVPLPPELRG